jgi:flavin reductase (DIM6/NTAB) family NADH-FMN oxidoreductase RutF
VAVTDQEFKLAMGRWPSGVGVVTAEYAGVPHGMTASSFTSVSLHPPLISVCVDRGARTLEAIQRSGAFAVNVLAEHQAALSVRFASPDDEATKFAGDPPRGVRGCPLIAGSVVQVQCRMFAQFDAGDHLIVVGEVEQAEVFPGAPLLYFHGKYGQFVAAD